jgi:hypothetical protein
MTFGVSCSGSMVTDTSWILSESAPSFRRRLIKLAESHWADRRAGTENKINNYRLVRFQILLKMNLVAILVYQNNIGYRIVLDGSLVFKVIRECVTG